jgi:hypothetical protein
MRRIDISTAGRKPGNNRAGVGVHPAVKRCRLGKAVSPSAQKVKGVFVITSFRFSDAYPMTNQQKADEQTLCIRPPCTQRSHPITRHLAEQPICRCRFYRLKPKKRFFFKTLGW